MTATTPFRQKPVINEDPVHAADAANVSSFIEQRVIHLRWRHVAEPVTAQELQGPLHLSDAQSRRMLSPDRLFCPIPGALNPAVTLYLLPVPVRAGFQPESFTSPGNTNALSEAGRFSIKSFNHLFSLL